MSNVLAGVMTLRDLHLAIRRLTAERDALKVELRDAKYTISMLTRSDLGAMVVDLREAMEALAKQYAAMPSGRGLAGVEPQTVANAIRMALLAKVTP